MSQSSTRPVSILKRPPSLDLERVSWDDLRMFVIAARGGSFRKAAGSLGTSAPTLARRMGRLERQIGVRLFDRLPEGIALTREGQHVLAAAQQMEQASLELRRYLDRDLTTRGIVRCSVTEGLGTYWILPKLLKFSRANPYTVVDLCCSMAHADVLRHEADVAVQLTRPTSPDLVLTKLGRLHIYLFASKAYLETFGAPRSVAELSQHRYIDQTGPQIKDGAIPGLLGIENIEGIVAMRTNSSTAHFYAIELGLGIGGLPTYAIPLGADVVPIEFDLNYNLDIWLTYHPDVKEIPRVAMFIDWLKEIFDPRVYPWFRDEFIHPREFVDWKIRRPSAPFEVAAGVVFDPREVAFLSGDEE